MKVEIEGCEEVNLDMIYMHWDLHASEVQGWVGTYEEKRKVEGIERTVTER